MRRGHAGHHLLRRHSHLRWIDGHVLISGRIARRHHRRVSGRITWRHLWRNLITLRITRRRIARRKTRIRLHCLTRRHVRRRITGILNVLTSDLSWSWELLVLPSRHLTRCRRILLVLPSHLTGSWILLMLSGHLPGSGVLRMLTSELTRHVWVNRYPWHSHNAWRSRHSGHSRCWHPRCWHAWCFGQWRPGHRCPGHSCSRHSWSWRSSRQWRTQWLCSSRIVCIQLRSRLCFRFRRISQKLGRK